MIVEHKTSFIRGVQLNSRAWLEFLSTVSTIGRRYLPPVAHNKVSGSACVVADPLPARVDRCRLCVASSEDLLGQVGYHPVHYRRLAGSLAQ